MKQKITVFFLLATIALFLPDRVSGALAGKSADKIFPSEDLLFKFDNGAVELKWEYIVLHHSATKGGTLESFDRYHRETFKDPQGLEYHFVIDNGIGKNSIDGRIEIGNRWKRQILANHLFRPERALMSIAICFVGNFEDNAQPTKAQFDSAVKLIKLLATRYKIPPEKIITHCTVDCPDKKDGRPNSVCPGKHFPYAEILKAVKNQLTEVKK